MIATHGHEMMPEMSGISDCGKLLCQDADELDVLFEISAACHRLTLKNLSSISARLCFLIPFKRVFPSG